MEVVFPTPPRTHVPGLPVSLPTQPDVSAATSPRALRQVCREKPSL